MYKRQAQEEMLGVPVLAGAALPGDWPTLGELALPGDWPTLGELARPGAGKHMQQPLEPSLMAVGAESWGPPGTFGSFL